MSPDFKSVEIFYLTIWSSSIKSGKRPFKIKLFEENFLKFFLSVFYYDRNHHEVFIKFLAEVQRKKTSSHVNTSFLEI